MTQTSSGILRIVGADANSMMQLTVPKMMFMPVILTLILVAISFGMLKRANVTLFQFLLLTITHLHLQME